jgi:hypothetical protein
MHSAVVVTSIGGDTPTANFAMNGRIVLAANQCSDVIWM